MLLPVKSSPPSRALSLSCVDGGTIHKLSRGFRHSSGDKEQEMQRGFFLGFKLCHKSGSPCVNVDHQSQVTETPVDSLKHMFLCALGVAGASQVVLVVMNPSTNAWDPCLENPMDRRTWQTTVQSGAKGWVWLTLLSTHVILVIPKGSTAGKLPSLGGGLIESRPWSLLIPALHWAVYFNKHFSSWANGLAHWV